MQSKLEHLPARLDSRRISRRTFLHAAALGAAGVLASGSRTQSAAGSAPATLTYLPGSSIKVEQIIGDADYAALAAGSRLPPARRLPDTTSREPTSAPLASIRASSCFSSATRSATTRRCRGARARPRLWRIARAMRSAGARARTPSPASFSTSARTATARLSLCSRRASTWARTTFPMRGSALTARSTSSAIGAPIRTSNTSNPHTKDYSVLAKFDENAQTFTTGRTISQMPGGHFIITALHKDLSTSVTPEPGVLMFGLGAYRATDVYLAVVPTGSFESGAGSRYFAGLSQGQPAWSSNEADAIPVVPDVVSPPTIGNVSVIFSSDLGLWLMTFDGGRGSEDTTGIYLAYASTPWGPWSIPQLIFNAERDNAIGAFISDCDARHPNVHGAPAGPTIGKNDIYRTRGGDYAPYLIERFTKVDGGTLTIHYTMSTWNPYTVIRMRSQFATAH